MKIKSIVLTIALMLGYFVGTAQKITEKEMLGTYYFAQVKIATMVVFDATSKEACAKSALTMLKLEGNTYTTEDSIKAVNDAMAGYEIARKSTMLLEKDGKVTMTSPDEPKIEAKWKFDAAKQELSTTDADGVTDTFFVTKEDNIIYLELQDENGQKLILAKQ